MKKLLLLLVLVGLFSCKKEKALTLAYNEPNEIKKSVLIDKNDAYSNLYGFWVGEISLKRLNDTKNPIRLQNLKIKIEKINDNQVIAKTISQGSFIETNGRIIEHGNIFKVELKEDLNKKITHFIYSFQISGNEIIGTRTTENLNFPFPIANFILHKKEFVYDKNNLTLPIDYLRKSTELKNGTFIDEGAKTDITDGIEKINASSQILTEKRLKNLKKKDLELIRNTVYARHGLIFKSFDLSRNFFYNDWYLPVSENVDSELTSLEKSNIELLTRFEKYAKENYSYFGR